jgi:hypothetical protein
MKPRRTLRDIFNRKSFRRASVTLLASAALLGAPNSESRNLEHLPSSGQPALVDTGGCRPAGIQSAIPYDEELLRRNDTLPPSEAVLKMNDGERIRYYMRKFCFEFNAAANDNARDKHIVEALEKLRAVTFTGQPLIDLADRADLHFCALKHMPAGTAAQFLPSNDIVAAGRNASPQGQVLDIAHEIMHAAQDRQGLLSYGFVWDIESRVRRNLAVEAAPIALEFAIAYEKKLAGDESYWDYLKTHDANTAYTSAENRRLFEATYQEGISAGLTSGEALRAGAKAIFTRVFESEDWRNFYLNSELNNYLDNLVNGQFRIFTSIDRDRFPQASVDLAGKIGDLPSFTQGAAVPALETLLNHDQKMRWAFEAVDLERHRHALGTGSPAVSALERPPRKIKTLISASISRR